MGCGSDVANSLQKTIVALFLIYDEYWQSGTKFLYITIWDNMLVLHTVHSSGHGWRLKPAV